MKRNLGTLDRVIRIVIGVALIAAAATGQIGWWGWLGIIPLGTALIGNCALYSLLGINTCRINKNNEGKTEYGRTTPANHAFRSNGKNP